MEKVKLGGWKKQKREEVKSELDENFLSLKFFSRFVRKKICEVRYKSQTPPTISCPIKLRIEDVQPLLLPFSIQTNIPFEVYKKDNNSAPDGSFHLILQQKKPNSSFFFYVNIKIPDWFDRKLQMVGEFLSFYDEQIINFEFLLQDAMCNTVNTTLFYFWFVPHSVESSNSTEPALFFWTRPFCASHVLWRGWMCSSVAEFSLKFCESSDSDRLKLWPLLEIVNQMSDITLFLYLRHTIRRGRKKNSV